MKLELPRGAFGGDVCVENYYALDTLEWNTVAGEQLQAGRVPTRAVDYRIPSNDPGLPGVRAASIPT